MTFTAILAPIRAWAVAVIKKIRQLVLLPMPSLPQKDQVHHDIMTKIS